MALTRLQDPEQAAKDVERLAQDIEKLRSSYEQYFLGLEKREPSDLRAAVIGQIRKYASSPIQNARLKFRYQQSVARYNTYTTYWDRILREIEEGRYVREVFKAKIHEHDRGVTPKEPASKPALPA
jgi:hypothetical protein